jgi:mannose-1-phosphate guanylyltransferase/phosphomannomutase
MKAVIMAGGFGTRLRPLTCNIPKPMVPMANKPMIEHIVSLLVRHGIRNLVVTLFYQPEVISNFFGDGSYHQVHIQYRKAEADFGTAGSVRNARNLLDERFLVISGDVLTDFDLTKAIRFHIANDSMATLLLTRASNPLHYGVVLTDEKGRVTRFLEKPSWGEVFSDTINTGIYILEPEVLDLVPPKEEFDFSKNLFPLMLERDMPLYGYISEGYWRDVGNLSEYQESHLDILHGLVKVDIAGKSVGNVIAGENAHVETDQKNLTGRNIIGKNTRIHRGVMISNSVIGDDCEILPGAIIRNSVIWSGTLIGANAELHSDVVGNKCIIGDDAIIAENVFIGDKCVVGKRAHLYANIKLWPEKIIEEGAKVTKSLVWEDRWLSELFTDARVTGISNIEMTPEFGARLGAAFGALVGTGATVVTSRDSDNVSRMMNRAIMCGLMSAGVHCSDLRATSIPIVRHELQSGKERGGIHVRKSPFDKNLTDIIFFDADGKDLPTSKTKGIERLFFGEDFVRASYDRVGTITFPERTTESYIERFLAAINLSAIRPAGLKIVIDYSNGIASTIFPNILGNLNVQVIALNAYLDSRKLTRSKEEFDASIQQLSHVVTSLNYDIGVLLDAGAEKMFVVDEKGRFIDNDRMLTLMAKLAIMSNSTVRTIAVPISASAEVDLVAREFGVTVLRTRESHLALMEAASNKEIPFVGGTKGGFIFNEFLFAADGMYSVAKLLEFVAVTGKRLGKLDEETPRLHFVKKNVPCSWHLKGRVMRRLMKDTEHASRDLIEGVKVYPHNGDRLTSVFLNPDRSRPIFHINAESTDPGVAEALADEFETKLSVWISNES